MNNGSGLADVRIYLSLAAYPGEITGTTGTNGDFQTDLRFIPGDENVTVWAELAGYSFEPSNYHWRHYYGFDEKMLNFTGVANSSVPAP